MAATHNLCVKAGEYTTHDGQQRNRWQRIGLVFKHDDGGTSIKLECMPLGLPDWDGWVSVFPRDQAQNTADTAPVNSQTRPQQGGYVQQSAQPAQNRSRPTVVNAHSAASQRTAPPVHFDDDIPF